MKNPSPSRIRTRFEISNLRFLRGEGPCPKSRIPQQRRRGAPLPQLLLRSAPPLPRPLFQALPEVIRFLLATAMLPC